MIISGGSPSGPPSFAYGTLVLESHWNEEKQTSRVGVGQKGQEDSFERTLYFEFRIEIKFKSDF